VKTLKEKGIKIFVWTLDNKQEIERAKKLGVDGIVSNFSDRINPQKLLEKYRKSVKRLLPE